MYTHPTGVFYGGSGPVWSNRWLLEHLPALVGSAERLGIVDLHTGLGPWGHGELISHESSDMAGYRRCTAWWGDVRSMVDGESVSANVEGDWLGAVESMSPETELTAVALEFGTVDPVTVLQSLRADAVLHANGDPRAEGAPEVSAQVRAAFADDEPGWFEAIGTRFDEVVTAAMANMADGI